MSIPKINNDKKHLEELLKAALELVSNGHKVVPMGYNSGPKDYKMPLIKWQTNGPLDSEAAVIAQFRRLNTRVFGVAVVVKDRIFVDFDTNDSDEIFKLSPAPKIKTSKGYHYWYAHDPEITQNSHVDVSEFEERDNKKYQVEIYTQERLEVVPPSKHHSGIQYEWIRHYREFETLNPLPDDLRALCKTKDKGADKKSVKKFDLNQVVHEGGRHNALKKICAHYYQDYFLDRPLYMKKVEEWNQAKCSPPLKAKVIESMVDWTLEHFSEPKKQKQTKDIKTSELVLDLLDQEGNIALFHDQEKTGYAQVKMEKKTINLPIHSADFTEYLSFLVYKLKNIALSDFVCKEVQSILNAKAKYEYATESVYIRVAQVSDEEIYYDLCNDEGEVVKITKNGWSIINSGDAPVFFIAGTSKSQVRPVPGGEMRDFLELTNLRDKQQQMLFLCTLPTRLIRDIEHPIAYIHGPAGSAKTTMLKLAKELLDPSQGGVSIPMKNTDDIALVLANNWVFANDNLSSIKRDLSDFFCTMVTGGESTKRTLYKNSEITIHRVKNPAYMTGINIEAHESDLFSRLLTFKTESFKKGENKHKVDIFSTFEKQKPLLLGALFETLVQAMNIKDDLNLVIEHRMTDYGLWGAACAEALGYGSNSFIAALEQSSNYSAYDAIHSSSAGRALLKYLEETDSFEGTMQQLLRTLKDVYYYDDSHDEKWNEVVANNPESLGKTLSKLENSLQHIGITVDRSHRTGTERRVRISKDDSCDS